MQGTRREKIQVIHNRMPEFYTWEDFAYMNDGDLDFIIYELYG
jgi:hypothetical protein